MPLIFAYGAKIAIVICRARLLLRFAYLRAWRKDSDNFVSGYIFSFFITRYRHFGSIGYPRNTTETADTQLIAVKAPDLLLKVHKKERSVYQSHGYCINFND